MNELDPPLPIRTEFEDVPSVEFNSNLVSCIHSLARSKLTQVKGVYSCVHVTHLSTVYLRCFPFCGEF